MTEYPRSPLFGGKCSYRKSDRSTESLSKNSLILPFVSGISKIVMPSSYILSVEEWSNYMVEYKNVHNGSSQNQRHETSSFMPRVLGCTSIFIWKYERSL